MSDICCFSRSRGGNKLSSLQVWLLASSQEVDNWLNEAASLTRFRMLQTDFTSHQITGSAGMMPAVLGTAGIYMSYRILTFGFFFLVPRRVCGRKALLLYQYIIYIYISLWACSS